VQNNNGYRLKKKNILFGSFTGVHQQKSSKAIAAYCFRLFWPSPFFGHLAILIHKKGMSFSAAACSVKVPKVTVKVP
jgi:hypothetical protein